MAIKPSKTLFILILLIFCGCARLQTAPSLKTDQSQVELKVVFHGEAVSGALVYFYPKTAAGFSDKPAFTSPFTDQDGRAAFKIKSGSYYLIVLKKKNPHYYLKPEAGDLFCFYGGNPVFFAPGEKSRVGLNSIEVKTVTVEKVKEATLGANSGVKGKVLFDGKPLMDAKIYVYLDGQTHFRGPGSLEFTTIEKNGGFKLDLPPGQYYLIAKQRDSGSWAGPLEQGDYFGYPPQNPVTVREGEYLRFDLECVNKTRPRKRKASTFIKAGATAVTGTIYDQNGRPLKEAFAFAYKNQAMNGQRPPYISRRTGSDGRYVLDFDEPGKYYIGARNTSGGPPIPGDLYGEYVGNPAHMVELKDGEVLKKVDIKLKVME